MNNEIKVQSLKLQEAVNHLVSEVKGQFNINLNNSIVSDEKMNEITEFANEIFDGFEAYDDNLFDLAKALYSEGYNVLETAIELKDDKILIVNEVVKDYVLDKVSEHQEQLKKTFEEYKQEELAFER